MTVKLNIFNKFKKDRSYGNNFKPLSQMRVKNLKEVTVNKEGIKLNRNTYLSRTLFIESFLILVKEK